MDDWPGALLDNLATGTLGWLDDGAAARLDN